MKNYCKICGENPVHGESTPETELICADIKLEELAHIDWFTKQKMIRTFVAVENIIGEEIQISPVFWSWLQWH